MGLFQRLLSALGLRKQDPEHDDDPPVDHDGAADESRDGASASATMKDEVPSPDDVVRDPELEAQDDAATFDFERDIARYFTAEFRLEQGWFNRERREQLFAEYEIRDGAHWYQIKATFERWLESPVGKAKYPSEAALIQARMTTTQTVSVDELEAMIEDARKAKGLS